MVGVKGSGLEAEQVNVAASPAAVITLLGAVVISESFDFHQK